MAKAAEMAKATADGNSHQRMMRNSAHGKTPLHWTSTFAMAHRNMAGSGAKGVAQSILIE
jgi:hypothetical protein